MCEVLTELFGKLPVEQFGPKALKLVRAKMVELDWSRTYTNLQINRLKRMFRWATAEEMIPPSVIHGLSAVGAIRKGEPGVRETDPVTPVPQDWIDATIPLMAAQVAAMVRLQILTGARPGEVVLLRGCDIDRRGKVWVFKPHYHKNDYRGQVREIWIGPQAQAVLSLWSRDQPEEYLFSPTEAEQARRRKQRARRKTKVQPSQMDRTSDSPAKSPGDRYTTASYGKAVRYACRKADKARREELVAAARAADPQADVTEIVEKVYVPEWGVHRLRHNAATAIRDEFGVEMAQFALGHASMNATLIYAGADDERRGGGIRQRPQSRSGPGMGSARPTIEVPSPAAASSRWPHESPSPSLVCSTDCTNPVDAIQHRRRATVVLR
jgi:integrase